MLYQKKGSYYSELIDVCNMMQFRYLRSSEQGGQVEAAQQPEDPLTNEGLAFCDRVIDTKLAVIGEFAFNMESSYLVDLVATIMFVYSNYLLQLCDIRRVKGINQLVCQLAQRVYASRHSKKFCSLPSEE